ncbi:hypothetical protein RHGRI_016520 [Rhododendron griersonianum]|uniref:Uncharacterized protein n=1 Tax=Rhododendron griersonianum TaxID=479676 RepID=A0AAV6JUC6_9ERIC|nr:hypothetical protein RHGRI_016520 [Rhododendron griersonianum]
MWVAVVVHRYESDVKLGDTQCNIILSRLKPWMRLRSSKGKKMVLQDGSSNPGRLHSTESKGIIWSCTVSAPEMTAMLYSLSCSPLYPGCSQSAHLFANNISSTGTSVHMELGELNLHTAGEHEDCLKESLFGVETNTGCIMNITTVSLDWGRKDMESLEKDGPKSKVVLSVEVTGVGVYLTFKRIESLLSMCSINFSGDMGLENTVIADPKCVNYGSQGGRVIVSVSADGAPRSANIMSTISDECKKLKYCISLDIFQFSTSIDKEKQSTQMELERARSIYQEYLDDDRSGAICALFDMQNAKLLRSGGLKEITIRYLFSATDIAIRWEPDVHIALFELVLQVKLLIHNHKFQGFDEIPMENTSSVRGNEQKKETSVETIQYGKQKKKRESIFVVDLEMLSISAEVGDGVDAMVQVQSIFTENASIGIVLEGLVLSFNDARVFKSSRIQISRIPNVSAGSSDAEIGAVTSWDWVIQGLDVHICMPYRLQLCAIDDSIEEMLRALKLITAAKTKLVFPMKKDSAKPKQPSSTKFGCVKLCIHKLTVDIEEEPLQGWLDEHYQLMKNEASELSVRLKFLDELISRSRQCSETAEAKDSAHDGEILFSVGEEIDVRNASAVQKMEEEIYKQSFQSYYQACQNLVPSDGSGACKRGFQSGFKPSTSRTSLLSIYALELDVSLTSIIGGDDGMLELRNYTLPLFSGSSGSCEGRVVLAQQRSGVETFGVAFTLIFSVKVDRDTSLADYPRGEGEVTFGGVSLRWIARLGTGVSDFVGLLSGYQQFSRKDDNFWIAVISKAFEPPKLSPSWLYAQRKLNEGKQVVNGPEMPQDDSTNPPSINQGGSSPTPMLVATSGSPSSLTQEAKRENSPSGAVANNGSNHDSEEEGTRHFMVNIVEPQFNLHSEDSNGRFLLAADSGRVLARSFHSVLHIGYQIIGQALGAGNVHVPECHPEMTWNRKEFSVMLEHVQAHVAPTDVDPGAGLQWLPKICRSSPNRKRTGALLERVFVPCDMYFRYTRHNGGTTDLKMKPLKELSFNSRNLTATMTSCQYQVMLDVLTNFLFAGLPK